MKNLTSLYRSSLQAQTANSTTERNEAFRLRYQVYCLERGFEAPALFDDEIETDDYDDNAIHFLTRYRSTRSVLGVTRLVIDRSRTPGALPIESHGIPGVDHELRRLRQAADCVAEVSRLAVTRDLSALCDMNGRANDRVDRHTDDRHGGPAGNIHFHHNQNENYNQTVSMPALLTAAPANAHPRIIPQHISMGLLALLFNKSREAGITHWVVLLDAALARCYSRFGIQGEAMGPPIDHRGLRQPLLVNLVNVWELIQRRCPPLARLIQEFGVKADCSIQLGTGPSGEHQRYARAALAPMHMMGRTGGAASVRV